MTGRKPILLMSNLASGALVGGFALATSYHSAIALRAAGGLFMCSGIVIKSTIGDECSARGQARAMAARALGLGAAQLITPLAVGALADPCNLLDSGGPGYGFRGTPACEVGGWLHVFPYALPAVFIGLVGLVTTAANWWFLPTAVEMSPARVAGRRAARARLVAGLTCGRVRMAVPPALVPSRGRGDGPAKGTAGAASVMQAVVEEEEAAVAAARRPPPPSTPPRPRPLAVVSPFAAAAAERAPLEEAGGPSAAALGGRATAPAAVGDGNGRWVLALPQPQPPITTPTPSARLRSALDRVASAAARPASRLGRALTTSPSLARARASTLAALDRAALAMTDLGGGAGGPGGGEVDDLNDAAAAATRFRMARAGTLMATAGTAGAQLQPPPPPRPPSTVAPIVATDDPETAARPTPPPWYRHRPALLAIAAYAVSATVFCIVDELLPLYASAPVALNGLGLSTQQLSWAMSAAGVCLILTASFLYPPLQDRLGLAGVLSWGLVAGFFMCIPFYPLAFRVTVATVEAGWSPKATVIAVQAVLWVAGFLYAASYNCTNTSTQVLVNLTAPDGQVGVVNGAGNALSALSRVVAPILAAAMWGAAMVQRSAMPEQWLPYLVAGCVFLVGRVAMWALRVTDERMLGEEA